MLGAIVGDIIGSRFEGIKPESLDFELFTEESHFSDDTVLTLSVAKWLMDDPNHTHGGIIKSLRTVGWHHLGAGYGQRFYCWLRNNNPQPYGAWSNGCAMRVSPVGLYAKTLDEALELAKMSAEVTHNHPEGIKGAQPIAACVFLCKNGYTKEYIREYVETTFKYNLHRTIEEIRSIYKMDVSCAGSVPEAIIAFLEGNSFEEVIRLAISIGGDTDTIAAMAGSIAACCYEIPYDISKQCRSILSNDLSDILYDFEQRYLIKYQNYYTRANPGLIIFLINQSKSMEAPWGEGKTLAEQASISLNRSISEMGMRCFSGSRYIDSAYIVIIGHGGKNNSMEAELLRSGSIATLCTDDTIPVQHLKQMIPDGAGGTLTMDLELKQFVTPKSVGRASMSNAFQLASALVNEWVTRSRETVDEDGNPITRDDSLDPVPLIINISDGEPIDCEADVRKYASEIMDINCPDGNPLIFNIHLSVCGGKEICMPMTDSILPPNDKMSKLLFDISSALPETMVQEAKACGFSDAEVGVKTFMSNVTEVEKFVMFLNFGSKIRQWEYSMMIR